MEIGAIQKDMSKHPCFNRKAAGSWGRVHLPVAPRCNIQCNFCDRRYDCVNESRPGVTSAVINPRQAVEYMDKVLEKEPRITVAGIAGPGDPFANPGRVIETMRLLNKHHPQLIFCLSTNGLNLPPYINEIADFGVSHVTVTVNSVDPAIGAQIYAWVKNGGVIYQGEKGAALLMERQFEAIVGLKALGITVKVNTIVIPGINDSHVVEVGKVAAALGADIQNLIPLMPAPATPFGLLREPSRETINDLRRDAGIHISQMTHCRRCRADAVGLLCSDRSAELAPVLQSCAKLAPRAPEDDRPHVAVATREGMLVNQHLGQAASFQVWGRSPNGESYIMIEERQAPKPGTGPDRWVKLADILSDCRAVLASSAGQAPVSILDERGLKTHVVSGFIDDALHAVYQGLNMDLHKGRRGGIAKGCQAMGGGCG